MSETKDREVSAITGKSHWLDGWAVRGICSTAGQLLHVVSSFKSIGYQRDNSSLFGFAVVNLMANAINIIFGAQKKDDPHQLRFLKEQINQEIAPHLASGVMLPSAALVPAREHKDHRENKALYLLRKYSVTISEVGLRTAGAISLIIPICQWGNAIGKVARGESFAKTFHAVRNNNKFTLCTGYFALAGKAFTVLSKEPDPYNPEPPLMWRQVQEKLMFRISTISEAFGAAVMAYDRFKNQKMMFRGKIKPDYYGGVGNVLFDAGYVARWVSPYGVRQVDMEALYAHAAAALNSVPAEKRDAVTERIVTALAAHFKSDQASEKTIRAHLEPLLKRQEHNAAIVDKPQTQIQTGITVSHGKAGPEPVAQLPEAVIGL